MWQHVLDLRDASFCWTRKRGKVHAQKCKQPGSLQEFLMHLHWPYSQTCASDPQKSSPHRSYGFLSAYHFLAPNMLCYCCSPAAKPPQKTSFWTLRETALPRFVVPNWNKSPGSAGWDRSSHLIHLPGRCAIATSYLMSAANLLQTLCRVPFWELLEPCYFMQVTTQSHSKKTKANNTVWF